MHKITGTNKIFLFAVNLLIVPKIVLLMSHRGA